MIGEDNGIGREEKTARQHADLIAELLDSRHPKTEREHAAAREIERLRAEVAQYEDAIDKCRGGSLCGCSIDLSYL